MNSATRKFRHSKLIQKLSFAVLLVARSCAENYFIVLENMSQLPVGSLDCRGQVVTQVWTVQCAAMCYLSPYPTWGSSIQVSPGERCEWFRFEQDAPGTKTGSCTLCFSSESRPVTFTLTDASSSLHYVMQELLAIHWHQVGTGFYWIAVGPSGVFAVLSNGSPRYLSGSRNLTHPTDDMITNPAWTLFDGGMVKITVGKDLLYCTNSAILIYSRPVSESHPEGTVWSQVSGGLTRAILSEHRDEVWGERDDLGAIFRIQGVTAANPAGGGAWTQHANQVLSIGVSARGIWAVGEDRKVRFKSHDELEVVQTNDVDAGWTLVDDQAGFSFICAEGNEQWVMAVDTDGELHVREGISDTTPLGTGWRKFLSPPGVRQVSVFRDALWLTTTDNRVFYRHLGDRP